MKCYKSGGCGPYEMLSCSECPASKSSYLDKKAEVPKQETKRYISWSVEDNTKDKEK